MKLILSRKGFDSAAGGCPSPIIDGRPISLPIPTRMPTPTRFRDLANGTAELVTDLTKGRIRDDQPCHVDPDLDRNSLTRPAAWRGALGQVSAAQSHLANNNVGPGDLFLFWGLFRPASRNGGRHWQFTGAPEHRIFGWLQVDEVLTVGADPAPALARHPWLASHPHLEIGWPASNTVYVAREKLTLGGDARDTPGFGLLRNGHCLTAVNSRLPSNWTIPAWLNPRSNGVGMTYHPSERWNADNTLRAAARGQEFIADVGIRPDALEWAAKLLNGES